MQDDEGHMGTATTKMSSYRTRATANPSFTDKCRYNEGWEDIWLLVLGSAKGGSGEDKDDIIKAESSSGSGIWNYTFRINVSDPRDPYVATLYNGFAKTTDDAYKYEDCILSEFELSGSNEEAPTYTATFNSNYPKVNQTNPARVIPSSTTFPKSGDVKIYIAPEGTTDANMTNYEYPCYLDWNLTINNNLESVPCSGDSFGESTKVLGNREGTFSITLPWTDDTKHLEKVFETGAVDGETVTSANDVKKVMIVMEHGAFPITSGNTVAYRTQIKIPRVVITQAYSEQSGTDAKQISIEGNIEESGSESFITTIVKTNMSDLHIDNTPTESSP